MDAQVHAGYRHQQQQYEPEYPRSPRPGSTGQAAHPARRALGVAAGKAVAPRPGLGGFHNGEVRVPHPGPRHPADNFEPLIDECACEPHAQQIIPPALVPAPEHKQSRRHEEGLLPQAGEQQHDPVQHRGADGFEPVQ